MRMLLDFVFKFCALSRLFILKQPLLLKVVLLFTAVFLLFLLLFLPIFATSIIGFGVEN